MLCVVHDRYLEGAFSQRSWLRPLTRVGFNARAVPFEHSEVEIGTELFVATRPA